MLLGRDTELEQIGGLVADAQEGRGRALLIVGEPGIGKTSLIAEAVALARDLRVIEAEAVEAEASLPYALLGEVAAPLLEQLPELPEPQAAAMRAALALDPAAGGSGDRFATCAAFLSLLARAAEPKPLLVVVDDAQWLDSASAECLAYAARRLGGTRVALLAASRPVGGRAVLGSGDPERLTLPGLSDEDARALLRTTTPEATSSVVDALLEMSAGNPLALRELPAQLSEDQRLGRASIDHVPLAGEALLEAFESRLAALGSDDRGAVVVASAAMDRELAPVVGACRDLGIEIEALERAEAANVLTLGEGRISFEHPLLKAVAYERRPPNSAGAPTERLRATAATTLARGISRRQRSGRTTRSPICSTVPRVARSPEGPTARELTPCSEPRASARTPRRASAGSTEPPWRPRSAALMTVASRCSSRWPRSTTGCCGRTFATPSRSYR